MATVGIPAGSGLKMSRAEWERADVIQRLALQPIEALTAGLMDQREDASERAQDAPGPDEWVWRVLSPRGQLACGER